MPPPPPVKLSEKLIKQNLHLFTHKGACFDVGLLMYIEPTSMAINTVCQVGIFLCR